MKDLRELDTYRDVKLERQLAAMMGAAYDVAGQPWGGVFFVASCEDRGPLKAIVSRWRGSLVQVDDPPFDHLSVSRRDRCPTWSEMEQMKRLFFEPHEIAMQLHVAESEHISLHPHCLHIWRPCVDAIPMPPSWMVA